MCTGIPVVLVDVYGIARSGDAGLADLCSVGMATIAAKCTDLQSCKFPNIVTCGRHASINMIPDEGVGEGGFAKKTFDKSGTIYYSDFHPTLKLKNMFAGASAYASVTDAILGKVIASAVEKCSIPRSTALGTPWVANFVNNQNIWNYTITALNVAYDIACVEICTSEIVVYDDLPELLKGLLQKRLEFTTQDHINTYEFKTKKAQERVANGLPPSGARVLLSDLGSWSPIANMPLEFRTCRRREG